MSPLLELWYSILARVQEPGGQDVYNECMRARVHVSFKTTVLDPQGQTIQSALNGLGHKTITGVRQGKYFDIDIDPSAAREDAAREMEQIAHDVLANPVMEDYQVEIID
jgi:phosphoribosylformylglycinamidine synthase subunit PurS